MKDQYHKLLKVTMFGILLSLLIVFISSAIPEDDVDYQSMSIFILLILVIITGLLPGSYFHKLAARISSHLYPQARDGIMMVAVCLPLTILVLIPSVMLDTLAMVQTYGDMYDLSNEKLFIAGDAIVILIQFFLLLHAAYRWFHIRKLTS